jgi:hypothetical protein
MGGILMKLHGPLATERVAVRRYTNAGEGCRETHGSHGNLGKPYYAAVKWSHQALLTGIQRISEKICASVRFPANLCPACISAERHAVCYRALPSDACQMAHGATIRAGQRRTTGDFQTPQRSPAWATSASGSIRAGGTQSQNLMKPLRKVNYVKTASKAPRENMSP